MQNINALQMRRYTFYFLFTLPFAHGRVLITEVADKGSSVGSCGGADWIEFYNDDDQAISLAGYVLHDDKGPADVDSFTFPENWPLLQPNEYLVLCCGLEDNPMSPQFGIGGEDTVTLLDTQGAVVSSVGPLLGQGDLDVTYALSTDGSGYEYTTVPTPGSANVLEPPVTETVEERKARLAAQNAMGTQFFGMDDNGYPVPDRLEDVLDLKLFMEEEDYEYTMEHPWHENYRPFTSGKLLSRSDSTELLSLDFPGRLRPKGQSTLFFAICLGIPSIPWSIDFDKTNKNQTLYGAGRVYLRNKLSDRSYMREWVFHRMLARFGLPHLRTRTVRFFLNDNYMGMYDLMEAPDSEYVFARSFPDYDPDNSALYKIKTASTSCGKKKYYNASSVADAYSRINDTEPYVFERGEHRQDVAVLQDEDGCNDGFADILKGDKMDAVLAYVRHGEDCGKMLVEEGLIDRDFGVKTWDPVMVDFINTHLSNSTCAPGCEGSTLASEVNIENFLKVLAVFATIMHQDSPLETGHNYYLAQEGIGAGWKMVPYDIDNAATRVGTQICDEQCPMRMVHWAIVRPTCEALEQNQLAGPLLSDPTLHAQYIEYIREFVDILLDETFLEEIENHALALYDDASVDPWTEFYSHDYDGELTASTPWYSEGNPLLAVLRARANDILEQLEALDSGNYPRGPHQEEQVGPEEVCIDWRGTGLPPDSCYNNCQYDGCYEPTWTVPGVCDANLTGLCYHGQFDPDCMGIPNGETYPGMEARGEEVVFCQESVSLSVCLPPELEDTPPITDPIPANGTSDPTRPPNGTSPPDDDLETDASVCATLGPVIAATVAVVSLAVL